MNDSDDPVFGKWIDEPNVVALVQAYCDGLASADQIAELDALARESGEIRDYLIAHSFLVSQLVSVSAAMAEPEEGLALVPATSSATVRDKLVFTKGWRWLGLAASLAVGIWAAQAWWAIESPAPDFLGVLRHVSAASATEGLDPLSLLRAPTNLELRGGQYELSLSNGVSLTVAGPAELAVESSMVCRLKQGKITAVVPKNAEGFRILTQQAEIVDHGTRFGVAITPDGGTDVAVFEGEVEVHSGDQQRSLDMGRAVSVARDGAISRMSLVKPDSFEVSRRTLGSLGPAIVSVHDNIRSPLETKYYRIVHEGFGEDQPAYVDRVHQWNGIDERGLPNELIGADYVMTFNDDRAVQDIVISVTLGCRSDIYVLLDERLPPPTWLTSDYVNTGMKVGMDEGERPGRPEDPRTLGEGVGNSIDYHFQVWKRNRASEGTVEFGGLPQMTDYRSMYGILAVPQSIPSPAVEAELEPSPAGL